VQRDGGEWCPFCVEAAHEFGGEVLSLGHASAVAGDQQPPACLMTIGDTLIHEAAGEDISAWIAPGGARPPDSRDLGTVQRNSGRNGPNEAGGVCEGAVNRRSPNGGLEEAAHQFGDLSPLKFLRGVPLPHVELPVP
jgi:hypothetical protein